MNLAKSVFVLWVTVSGGSSMDFQLPTLKLFIIISITLWLTACGGSGGGGGGGSNSGPETYYGFFIDDAVQDLIVEAASGSVQRTDENGVFSFNLNDPLTFKIDDLVLGSIPSGLERLTPNELNSPNLGNQVFRFVQAMDTTPGTPGIDLSGLDLPSTPINFSQSNSFFENDPAVIAALAASQAAGATGVLIDRLIARDNFLASTNRIIVQIDFEDLVAYPVSATGPNEPCLVFFNADLSGESVCRDDIAADPANAAENFTWFIDNALLVADIDADTQVTVTKNGTTGNRIHVTEATECLTCDPNLAPTIEIEYQTYYTALPIDSIDFSGQVLTLSTASGTATATFAANGTVSFSDANGVETANWSVNPLNNVLLLEGTGTPGAIDLSFAKAILIEGSVNDGQFAVLNALVDDANNDGIVDQAEFDINGVYDGVEVQTSTP